MITDFSFLGDFAFNLWHNRFKFKTYWKKKCHQQCKKQQINHQNPDSELTCAIRRLLALIRRADYIIPDDLYQHQRFSLQFGTFSCRCGQLSFRYYLQCQIIVLNQHRSGGCRKRSLLVFRTAAGDARVEESQSRPLYCLSLTHPAGSFLLRSSAFSRVGMMVHSEVSELPGGR